MTDFVTLLRTTERLGTGPISDAMEQLQLPRTVLVGWHFVTQQPLQAIVGPAFTVRQTAKPRSQDHDQNSTRQGEVATTLARPGDVILIDTGNLPGIATWGETYSVIAQSRRIAGLIINGALRDSARVQGTGFPVLCRSFAPVASRWDLTTAAVNEPLTISGVLIHPGDILYGDADGLLVLPQETAASVLRRALEIARQEDELRGRYQ